MEARVFIVRDQYRSVPACRYNKLAHVVYTVYQGRIYLGEKVVREKEYLSAMLACVQVVLFDGSIKMWRGSGCDGLSDGGGGGGKAEGCDRLLGSTVVDEALNRRLLLYACS